MRFGEFDQIDQNLLDQYKTHTELIICEVIPSAHKPLTWVSDRFCVKAHVIDYTDETRLDLTSMSTKLYKPYMRFELVNRELWVYVDKPLVRRRTIFAFVATLAISVIIRLLFMLNERNS